MNDKQIEELVKSIDSQTAPPEGLKEKLLQGIMDMPAPAPYLSPFEKFIFEKPLRTAFALSLAVSGSIWAAMGNSFADFFSKITG